MSRKRRRKIFRGRPSYCDEWQTTYKKSVMIKWKIQGWEIELGIEDPTHNHMWKPYYNRIKRPGGR